MKCLLIGITGGSGSGKSLLSNLIQNEFGSNSLVVIHLDNYYFNRSATSNSNCYNFDHPNSIDFLLAASNLTELKKGNSIEMPIYDFNSHSRLEKTRIVKPKPIIIMEGILVLNNEILREKFDYSIYVQAKESTRLSRRLARDAAERGRSKESIEAQFKDTVVPMHYKYVRPTKKYSNHVFVNDSKVKIKLNPQFYELIKIINSL